MANPRRNSEEHLVFEKLRTLPRIQVLLEWDDEIDRWRAYVPQLGHISSSGLTEEDVLADIRQRILTHLETHADIQINAVWQDLPDVLNDLTGGVGQRLLVHEEYEIAVVTPLEHPDVIQEFEDCLDLEEARDVLSDPVESILVPWEDVKLQFGQSS